MMRWYFCGIGGSGMSALAQLLQASGAAVCGSDRGFDQGNAAALVSKLQEQNIKLYRQDGSGPMIGDIIVVSTAVEESVLDIISARALGLEIIHRSELLARIFNEKRGIAVGGTSGKSTVTAMIGHILYILKHSPTIVNGAEMPIFTNEKWYGNCYAGKSEVMVIEADESDGSIVNYQASIGIINNISKDHKSLSELREIFMIFANNCKRLVINADCVENHYLLESESSKVTTFGIVSEGVDFKASEIVRVGNAMSFKINGAEFYLPQIGNHNIENVLAAVATCSIFGYSLKEMATALSSFGGISRRMQLIGIHDGITVIDDFAHNPDKVRAVLEAVGENSGRLHVIFQPHGYGPTKFLFEEFVSAFVKNSRGEDVLYFPEIYYAGGSASKEISSADLVREIVKQGREAKFISKRENIIPSLVSEVKSGDLVLILGARDVTLGEFAKNVFNAIKNK
ncbi:MAG: UDP-N-acetylmuramate--L-alanine ligase [Lentisphaeria bacterium]